MRLIQHHLGSWFLVLVAIVLLPATQTHHVHAEEQADLGAYVWLDLNGQPLPFQDDQAIMDVLRTAEVISRTKIDRGVTEPEKLVLQVGTTRFHAVFRTVDRRERAEPAGRTSRRPKHYRDAAIFESAAYELSQMLGINRVPPVVERQIDTQTGTIQIWMEETLPEVERIERKILPSDEVRWAQQKQIMTAFDILIANTDRNQGNSLIDHSWTLWFIDHTRGFKDTSKLLKPDRLVACERRLWNALRGIDEETIRRQLEPFLGRREISALLKRRLKLVKHIEKLIKKHGEDVVLFDLRPPGTERAEWSD